MTIRIAKEIQFDAGHRLMKHEGQCSNVHGHRYRAVLHVEATGVDAVGRVLDFSTIKTGWGGWIVAAWDHAFLFQVGDPIGEAIAEAHLNYDGDHTTPQVGQQKVFERGKFMPARIGKRQCRMDGLFERGRE